MDMTTEYWIGIAFGLMCIAAVVALSADTGPRPPNGRRRK